jgi:hypothetical protein
MHLTQDLKRIALAFAITIASLAICITYIEYSHYRYTNPAQSADAVMHRTVRVDFHPGHGGEHPKPWLKIFVTHAISIASRFGA